LMKIPASDRQEVMKAIPLRTLLSELEKRKFTGYCAMPIAGASALLVMEGGKYILAEYRGIRGKDALESIRAIGNIAVDVVLAPFSGAQVKETSRTNEAFLVDVPGEAASRPGRDRATSATVIRPVSVGGATGKPVKVIAVQTRKPDEKAPAGVPGRKGKVPQGRAVAGKAAPSGGAIDRKGLEHLKTMRESFKNDAADLLSELNLGHLAVNRAKTDKGNEGEGGEKGGTG